MPGPRLDGASLYEQFERERVTFAAGRADDLVRPAQPSEGDRQAADLAASGW